MAACVTASASTNAVSGVLAVVSTDPLVSGAAESLGGGELSAVATGAVAVVDDGVDGEAVVALDESSLEHDATISEPATASPARRRRAFIDLAMVPPGAAATWVGSLPQ